MPRRLSPPARNDGDGATVFRKLEAVTPQSGMRREVMNDQELVLSNLPVARTDHRDAVTAGVPALYARLVRLLGSQQRGRAHKVERRRLFATSPDLILLVNCRGQFVEVSRSSVAILGYQPEEMTGRNGTEFLHPPDREKTRKEMRSARAGHLMHNFECRHLHKDGRVVTLEWTGIWSEPEQRHFLIGRDVTISRRNEGMKDEFVATVSHELRTPLTSIAASLALLAGGAAGALPDSVMRLIAIAHTNAQRLVRLINDILDIEKIESGTTIFKLGRVAARRLVEQAIEANRGFAAGFGVSVRLNAASEEAMVRADPDRLTQVVTNLLSNAVKFSPRGREVEVRIGQHLDNVRIAICDRGCGIPQEFGSRIFEKFAQADASDARQKGGTGLGLSIVKQIMIRLNGDVGFEPNPGGGTIFYVDLPRWDAKTMFDSAEQGNGTLILLCEDDPHSADILCDHLRRAGFNPDVVHTADQAMGSDAQAPYAAILVDLRLPDSDGITLIKHLRSQRRYQDTPIVVVSVDPTHRCEDERPSSLHVLDWLGKPVDMDRLIAALNSPIVRKTARRPRILHASDDPAVLRSVADALRSTTDVVSVDSVKDARRALAENGFDAAVIDVTLAEEFGLDLLPDLYGTDGHTIPVVVFSAKDTPEVNARVLAVLTKSRASIDSLIATLRKLVTHGSLEVETQKEVA
jgi:PAS domain S-box-containing protein